MSRVSLSPVAVALALLLLLLAQGARAAIDIDGEKRGEVTLDPLAVDDVRVPLRFVLDEPAVVYAKLLVTGWSPVNDGVPNGTVTPAHDAGVDGWWVAFRFLDLDGRPLAGDAPNATANETPFHVVDSTPTPSLLLDGGLAYRLETTIHFPDAALVRGAEYEVSWSLAGRPGATLDVNASGASRDPSVAFTQTIRVPPDATGFVRATPAPARARAAPAPGAGGAGEPGEAGTAPAEEPADVEVFPLQATAREEGPLGMPTPAIVVPALRDDSHYWILVMLACILVTLLVLVASVLGFFAWFAALVRRRRREDEERVEAPEPDAIDRFLGALERHERPPLQ